MNLTITHLYPQNLNLYGDIGNIIALKKRCEWHEIETQIINLNIGDKFDSEKTDLYFMGGGQDNDQVSVVSDFHKLKAEAVKKDTENFVPFLGVCGGYQLMGNTFLMGDGRETDGLGIINVDTKAPGIEVKERCIGNLIAEIEDKIYDEMKLIYKELKYELPKTLVGFENHSGQTYLNKGVEPLAITKSGFGNNHTKTTEGAKYKNVFGSYMHGSLLPKNPHFADYLIWLALKRKYPEKQIQLEQLDDKIELTAHEYIVENY